MFWFRETEKIQHEPANVLGNASPSDRRLSGRHSGANGLDETGQSRSGGGDDQVMEIEA